MKYYEVSYAGLNGGIDWDFTKYYKANRIEDVIVDFLEDYEYTQEDINSEDFYFDLYTDKQFKIDGEFNDQLSSGGDFIYADLLITEISQEEISIDIELTFGDLELTPEKLYNKIHNIHSNKQIWTAPSAECDILQTLKETNESTENISC